MGQLGEGDGVAERATFEAELEGWIGCSLRMCGVFGRVFGLSAQAERVPHWDVEAFIGSAPAQDHPRLSRAENLLSLLRVC